MVVEPLPYTLLSLPRYAQIMGINPVYFQGAQGQTVFPLTDNRCNDLWPRYSWQRYDCVSHYDLALAIRQAEEDLAEALGWWPAPTWTSQEIRDFPRHYRRDLYRYYGENVRNQRVSIKTAYAKLIAPGIRNVGTKLGTVTPTYSDDDSDGFNETATVELTTSLTDVSEIKVYFAGESGEQEWEIRPARKKYKSGGKFYGVFNSWLFIDPELQGAFPTTAGFTGIDISTDTNFVTTVDIYREQNDVTDTSATFYWEPTPSNTIIDGFCTSCLGTGCAACSLTTQDGCLHIRDAERGFVVPQPASYNSTTGAWETDCYTLCRDPDFVKIWYYSGLMDERWLRGTNAIDPLSQKWANAIAWIATARLDRPFCSCGNATVLGEVYRQNLAANSATDKQAEGFQVDPVDVLQCPFGTRLGEVMAWKLVARERDRITGGGAI